MRLVLFEIRALAWRGPRKGVEAAREQPMEGG